MRFTRRILSLALICCAMPALAADAPTTRKTMGSPTVPTLKPGENGQRFLAMHEKFLQRAKEGNIDLLFLGDSITENWTRAQDLWNQRYAPLHAANFGIGGDRTQHVLWRITNGELDGIHPKVVVLLIGTNNANGGEPESITNGIKKIIDITREKTGAKILLMAIFPRDREQDTNGQMQTIHAINQRISQFDDGQNIRFLDIGQKFLLPDGKLDQSLFSDGLHPNEKGYQIWSDAMAGLLEEMMKS